MNRRGPHNNTGGLPAEPAVGQLRSVLIPYAGWLILIAAFVGLFGGHLAGQRHDSSLTAGSVESIPTGSRLRDPVPVPPRRLPGSRERIIPPTDPPPQSPLPVDPTPPEGGSIDRIPPVPGRPRIPIGPPGPNRRPPSEPGRSPGIRPEPTPDTDHHSAATVESVTDEDPTADRLRDLMAVAALLLIFLMATTVLIAAFRLLARGRINTALWHRQLELVTGTARQIDQTMICVLREDWPAMQAALEQLTSETGLRVLILPEAAHRSVSEFLAAALQCHHHRNDEEYLPGLWQAAEQSMTALRNVIQSPPLSDHSPGQQPHPRDTFTSIITAPRWSRRLR